MVMWPVVDRRAPFNTEVIILGVSPHGVSHSGIYCVTFLGVIAHLTIMPKVDTMCPTKFIPLSLDTIIGPCATVFSKKFCDLGP